MERVYEDPVLVRFKYFTKITKGIATERYYSDNLQEIENHIEEIKSNNWYIWVWDGKLGKYEMLQRGNIEL